MICRWSLVHPPPLALCLVRDPLAATRSKSITTIALQIITTVKNFMKMIGWSERIRNQDAFTITVAVEEKANGRNLNKGNSYVYNYIIYELKVEEIKHVQEFSYFL